MKRFSKADEKFHKQALDLIHSDRPLKHSEKLFIIENFQEASTGRSSADGAFFTPLDLVDDFCLEIYEGRKIIDLCAGIGNLSFGVFHNGYTKEITCVEVNYSYVEVGKRILPEANWLIGDITDESFVRGLGNDFKQIISNPPFGKIKSAKGDDVSWTGFNNSEFEYKAILVGSILAEVGSFILPQESCPYRYSGNTIMEFKKSKKLEKFEEETGIDMNFNAGIDTCAHQEKWKHKSVIVEIISVDYEEFRKKNK